MEALAREPERWTHVNPVTFVITEMNLELVNIISGSTPGWPRTLFQALPTVTAAELTGSYDPWLSTVP